MKNTVVRDLILGIDPGFTGAVCLLNFKKQKLFDVWDMPTIQTTTKNQRVLDSHKLATMLDFYSKQILFAVVEKVTAAPDSGVTSMFRFGQGFGVIQGILASAMIPTFYVTPSVWKHQMGLSSDKNQSIERAIKLFPDDESFFKRKKDNGRAEAVLLSVYGVKNILSQFTAQK